MNRIEKKTNTRHAMMMAALHLVETGHNFSTLSIREITRQTGVVPTSFYRHFASMDALGMGLVDELSLKLRTLMRKARSNGDPASQMIRNSVDIYFTQVDENRAFFVFLCQEMTGGSTATREAIRKELDFFANELVADMNRYHRLSNLSAYMLEITAQLAIQIVTMSTAEMLDIPVENVSQRSALRLRMIRQLQLTFLGGSHWKESESQS